MASQGTYDTSGPAPVLRFERRLAQPVDDVWRAVGDAGAWFPTQVRGELRRGARLDFVFPGDDEPAGEGQVLDADPPRRLAFTWFGDVLRLDLEPAGDGTVLRFAHGLREVEAAARTMAGWHVCLDLLERSAAGERTSGPSAVPTVEWRAHYDGYVATGVPAGAPVPPG